MNNQTIHKITETIRFIDYLIVIACMIISPILIMQFMHLENTYKFWTWIRVLPIWLFPFYLYACLKFTKKYKNEDNNKKALIISCTPISILLISIICQHILKTLNI